LTAKNLTSIYSGVKKNDTSRNENDLYRTPPLATYILCKYSDVPRKVVEPCAGYGNIAVELMRQGHDVLCSDLNHYEDALVPILTPVDVMNLPNVETYDALVTNPPYHKDLPRKIAEKAVSEYDYVAMFVRLTFLEGKKRNKIFTDNPPTEIIFLSDRINFGCTDLEAVEMNDQIGGMISYMWIIWDKKATHSNTKLHWALLCDEYPEWRESYDRNKE
jgi:hypothetical protein